MEFKPAIYQQYCIDRMIRQKNIGLFLDMGMGKTAITLTALEKLKFDYFQVNKILVIAPLRPAIETWPAEIKKWDHLKHLTYGLAVGSAEERLQILKSEYDIYIINRENVPWLVQQYKAKWPFDAIVIDELSSFKSSKSQRFRSLKSVRPYIRRLIGLTGTPAPNGLLDLWPQMYLIDQGEALGRTLSSYRDAHFMPDRRNAHIVYSWKLRQGHENMIYDRLQGSCISMRTEDFIELPECLRISHKVQFPKEVKDKYAQFKRDMITEEQGQIIDGVSAGVMVNKLIQFTGGAVYDEEKQPVIFHDEKLKVLDQLIEEANGQSVLVFYGYRHERDRILARYPGAVDIKSENAIARWNAGNIPILVAHPASAGHGLNLQEGGHIAIWYSIPTSLELYQQANKRLHRMGQKIPVLIHHIIVEHSIDERIIDTVLANKAFRQAELIEAVKAELERGV